jgi:competence CoiA-like predicted nuclease
MPLRAQLDGNSINAALLSETQWEGLKGSRSLRMPCCDALAYRRTSRLETRHFAKSPGSHCGAEEESAEHLAAKAEIVRGCHELKWDAISEYVGDQWRADVYAMRGRHHLAFEINGQGRHLT